MTKTGEELRPFKILVVARYKVKMFLVFKGHWGNWGNFGNFGHWQVFSLNVYLVVCILVLLKIVLTYFRKSKN